MSTKVFSILIANYNNGAFFTDCWNSIINQTYRNFEVVIFDDASTDDSVELIENIIAGDNRFLLYRNDRNRGCGYAKRKCIELSSGEICGFLDPDDTLTPDALEIMVKAHFAYPDHSIIYSSHFVCDKYLDNPVFELAVGQIPDGYSQINSPDYVISHFATFKRSKYNQTKGLNRAYRRAVDQDLYYRLEEVGKARFINKALYYYRVHENGISNNSKAMYSHLLVVRETYKRRKKMGIKNEYPFNLSKTELYNRFDGFYLWSAKENLLKGNFLETVKWTFRSFVYIPANRQVVTRFSLLLKAFVQGFQTHVLNRSKELDNVASQ